MSVTSVFCTDNVKETLKTTNNSNAIFKHTVELDVLELEPVKDLNGDETPEDPFFAFGRPVLIPGISDQIGPQVQNKKTALTDVNLKSSSYTYTGKAIKPAVTVKAGKKTVPASEYTVSYADNKNVGYATVTVKAKGSKYSGAIVKGFQIIPKGTALKSVRKNGTKAALKWKKQSAKMSSRRITGYQIRYSTKPSMKKAKTVTVKGYKKTGKMIKHLKKNRKYYFQIRTYMKLGKKIFYSKWSSRKAVK